MEKNEGNKSIKNTARIVLALLIGGLFILAGILKLVGMDFLKESFIGWGYSVGFMFLIGLLELAGGVAILIPRLSTWGSLLIAVVMTGAAYTHVTHSEPTAMLPVLVMAASVFLAYLGKEKAMFLSSSSSCEED